MKNKKEMLGSEKIMSNVIEYNIPPEVFKEGKSVVHKWILDQEDVLVKQGAQVVHVGRLGDYRVAFYVNGKVDKINGKVRKIP